MNAFTSALMHAGEAARRSSTIDGKRDVEIIVTELGFVVRGRTILARTPACYSVDIHWPQFDQYPEILCNSVALVVEHLDRVEAAG